MDQQKRTDLSIQDLKRNYNLHFKPSFYIYPYYFLCNNEILVESIKYNLNIDLDKSFLPAANGYTCPGYIAGFKPLKGYDYLNEMRLHLKKENYININGSIVSADTFDGLIHEIKKELAQNRIVPVFGSSYFLHYSPTYMDNTESFIENHERYGSMHQYFVIDIINDGDILVYDTTFIYYGVVTKDDFAKSVKGIMDIPLLKNHPSVKGIKPYRFIKYDFSNNCFTQFDKIQVAKKILNDFLYNFFNLHTIKFGISKQETVYVGFDAIKKLISDLKENEKHNISDNEIVDNLRDYPDWLARPIEVIRDFITDLKAYYSGFTNAPELLHSIAVRFSKIEFTTNFASQINALESIANDLLIVQNILKESLNKEWK